MRLSEDQRSFRLNRIAWFCAGLASTLVTITAVMVATQISTSQQASPIQEDSRAAMVGVFVSPEDSVALASVAGRLEWSMLARVAEGGYWLGVGLAEPEDHESSWYGTGVGFNSHGGVLNEEVSVVFMLPAVAEQIERDWEQFEQRTGLSRAQAELLDSGLTPMPWEDEPCATWTLANGEVGSVMPVADTGYSSRSRFICTIPALGEVKDFTLGVSVFPEETWDRETMVGVGAFTLALMSQPSRTPGDELLDDALEPVGAFRIYAVANSDVAFEESPALAGNSIRMSGELQTGQFLSVVTVDEDARGVGQAVVQLMWVLVGLFGGWTGVAFYRALSMRAPVREHDLGQPFALEN